MRRIIWLFIIFILISPWFWVFSKNYKLLSLRQERSVCIQDPIFIDRINALRGESQKAGLPFGGRPLVNKVTFCAKDIIERYLESFDAHFLFFVGDLDFKKSTRSSGPLYLSFLPLILFGLFYLLKDKNDLKRKIFVFLLITPLPSAFILSHYESLSKIPLFLVLTFLASFGFSKLFSQRRFLAILFIVTLLFETARFYHDFFLHYPRKLDLQIKQQVKK